MSNIEQALKSAIEYIEAIKPYCFTQDTESILGQCKSALAEIEKCEPVARVVDVEDQDGNFHREAELLELGWKLPVDTELFTSPQQREWVDLSDKDINECLSAGNANGWQGVLNATEAKLKQLNMKG